MVIVSGNVRRRQVNQLYKVLHVSKLSNNFPWSRLIITVPLAPTTYTRTRITLKEKRPPRYGKEFNITTSTILTTITTPHRQGTRPSECHRQLTTYYFFFYLFLQSISFYLLFFFLLFIFYYNYINRTYLTHFIHLFIFNSRQSYHFFFIK